MPDVVVVGGGLSGLSACYELDKHQIRYTVIEVKKRFGGSIVSTAAKGFIADAYAFAFQDLEDVSLLFELGLDEDLFEFGPGSSAFAAEHSRLSTRWRFDLRARD